MIDRDGNWILPIGQDLELEQILYDPAQGIQENIPPLAPPPLPLQPAQSLIPDRRAAARRRPQRRQHDERVRTAQIWADVFADDERESQEDDD